MSLLILLLVFALGCVAGDTHRDGARRRWLLRNAWALNRKGENYGAALVRELANGRDVVCPHRLDAGSCPHCMTDRLRAGEAL